MTITITKWRLAIAIVAVALIAPATALATHVFDDVADDKFYADPVEWAFNNNITTGKSPTIFDPEGNVTRGESVTFLSRYDTNIVQPGIDDLRTDVDSNAGDIAALDIPVVHWAWVSTTGTLSAGSSGVSAGRSAVGEYVVTFPDDVSGCSWSVAHRSTDGFFIIIDPDFDDEPSFDLSTRTTGFFPSRVVHPEDIRVHVTDELGNDKNSDFNLQVIC